jgi:sulfopyruvate decarboxylase TPP-binding subunit
MNTAQTQRLLDAFDACEIKYLIVVPATGLEAVFKHFEARERCIYATREEEAVAIATGLTLGGEKPVVVMAQAGVGNALNAVFTLADAYAVYFPILVCFRGKEDPNLVQRISASQTHLVLDALDCAPITWEHETSKDEFQNLLDRRQRWIRCAI